MAGCLLAQRPQDISCTFPSFQSYLAKINTAKMENNHGFEVISGESEVSKTSTES